MWARRAARSPKRNASGISSIRRESYNTVSGFSTKSGWWDIRAKVVKRSNNKCEATLNGKRCGAPGKEVHHIISLKNGGTSCMGNLIMLCLDCHDRRHNHLARTRGHGYGHK